MRKMAAISIIGFGVVGAVMVPYAAAAAHSPVSGGAIARTALHYVGYHYSSTTASPRTGFSSIGLVSYVYRKNGIKLPDNLQGALDAAPGVSITSLKPGDVVYFQNTVSPGLSHAGIYIGGRKFVHARWFDSGVTISSFTNDPRDRNYWMTHYLAANRPWKRATPTVRGHVAALPASGANQRAMLSGVGGVKESKPFRIRAGWMLTMSLSCPRQAMRASLGYMEVLVWPTDEHIFELFGQERTLRETIREGGRMHLFVRAARQCSWKVTASQ